MHAPQLAMPAKSRDTELAEDHGNASRVLGPALGMASFQVWGWKPGFMLAQNTAALDGCEGVMRFFDFFRFSILRGYE